MTNAMIDRLAAETPAPDLSEKLALFGQFIGSWDMDICEIDADGPGTRLEGEWHFGWVLEGRTIQDVLVTWPAGASPASRARGADIGTTIRTYEPEEDVWFVTWHGPSERSYAVLLARKVDDRIVLEGQWSLRQRTDPSRRFEWSFSEITADSFTWQGRRSTDGGKTWTLVEEMHARRRS